MAFIPQEKIEEVKRAARIDDVIGHFIPLKKVGAGFACKCPFHSDLKQKLTITPAKGIFKCFVCGKGGDSIAFMMHYKSLTYPDAIKFLADRYNVIL